MSEHPTFIKNASATYIRTHHGTAVFYIPGGSYSIADIEQLLEDMKETKEMHDKHLAK